MTAVDWNSVAKTIATQIWSKGESVELSEEIPIRLGPLGHSIDSQSVLGQFDRLKDRVTRILNRKILECKEIGVAPRLLPSAADPDTFVAKSGGSQHQVQEELGLAIKGVSWREFEQLSVFVLRLNGVTKCYTMRGTKEEGIDVFGELDLGKITASTIWHNVPIRILGQAKMGKLSEPRVRLFNQDLGSFLKGEGRAFDLAPAWFRNSRTPVIGFMLTADSITGTARAWAKKHSIALKDSRQIVDNLLRHQNEVPGITLKADVTTFRLDTFREFVSHLDFNPAK
jgi:hypothetical protein